MHTRLAFSVSMVTRFRMPGTTGSRMTATTERCRIWWSDWLRMMSPWNSMSVEMFSSISLLLPLQKVMLINLLTWTSWYQEKHRLNSVVPVCCIVLRTVSKAYDVNIHVIQGTRIFQTDLCQKIWFKARMGTHRNSFLKKCLRLPYFLFRPSFCSWLWL